MTGHNLGPTRGNSRGAEGSGKMDQQGIRSVYEKRVNNWRGARAQLLKATKGVK